MSEKPKHSPLPWIESPDDRDGYDMNRSLEDQQDRALSRIAEIDAMFGAGDG